MIELDTAWLSRHLLPEPDGDTDKNARGRVLAVGGSMLVPGALLLTGEAALRAGAGKIQLATVEPAALLLGMHMPEAAVIGLPGGAEGELASAAGTALAGFLDRCDALVLGPGMGLGAEAEPILRAVLAAPEHGYALVLDAAMLSAAAVCADGVCGRRSPVVLTPHPGEMCALMGCDENQLRAHPEAIVQQAAERFDATVVLKGAQSWIASPGEMLLRYPGGGPGLATAGSGDVLAGIIGGLLARGALPRIATAWGVWCHGEAGHRLANRRAPLGFLARELLAEIPTLLDALRRNG